MPIPLSRTRQRALVLLVAGVTGLSLAACSSSGNSSTPTGPTSVSHPPAAVGGASGSSTVPPASGTSASSSLPANIQKAGSITIATSADYPPFEAIGTDGKTIVGFDPDLGHALGKALGIKVNFINGSFDGLIPGLASGKYTAVMAGMQDIATREKTVTFVDYISIGSQLAVPTGNPEKIQGFPSLCGKSVAAEKGTTQVAFANKQSKACTTSGKKAISVQVYNNENDANLAVTSKRVDAVFAQTATQAIAVQRSSGQLEVAGPVYDKQHVGIALPKDEAALAPALEGALKTVMADGTYKSLLAKWHLESGAISAPAINQPLS